MKERIPYTEFEIIVSSARNRIELKYPDTIIRFGNNNLIMGHWVDTKPYKTFIPLQTKDGLSIKTDYTTNKSNYKS